VPTVRKGRRVVSFLLSWAAVDFIEALAKEEGIVDEDGEPNRSEMMRNMLAYAAQHRPKGWRPQ
jgi:hypothetical protein